MIKKIVSYVYVGTSSVLHKRSVSSLCYYVARSTKPLAETTFKKRTDRVCDECQRLAKLKK
jgi:hypothetical protein